MGKQSVALTGSSSDWDAWYGSRLGDHGSQQLCWFQCCFEDGSQPMANSFGKTLPLLLSRHFVSIHKESKRILICSHLNGESTILVKSMWIMWQLSSSESTSGSTSGSSSFLGPTLPGFSCGEPCPPLPVEVLWNTSLVKRTDWQLVSRWGVAIWGVVQETRIWERPFKRWEYGPFGASLHHFCQRNTQTHS